ncbi:hypothetical protein SNEBB_002180 [Seison nebaliae]|nr:hypothetical protein SNEBB_002180 [Seison nebaliae]
MGEEMKDIIQFIQTSAHQHDDEYMETVLRQRASKRALEDAKNYMNVFESNSQRFHELNSFSNSFQKVKMNENHEQLMIDHSMFNDVVNSSSNNIITPNEINNNNNNNNFNNSGDVIAYNGNEEVVKLHFSYRFNQQQQQQQQQQTGLNQLLNYHQNNESNRVTVVTRAENFRQGINGGNGTTMGRNPLEFEKMLMRVWLETFIFSIPSFHRRCFAVILDSIFALILRFVMIWFIFYFFYDIGELKTYVSYMGELIQSFSADSNTNPYLNNVKFSLFSRLFSSSDFLQKSINSTSDMPPTSISVNDFWRTYGLLELVGLFISSFYYAICYHYLDGSSLGQLLMRMRVIRCDKILQSVTRLKYTSSTHSYNIFVRPLNQYQEQFINTTSNDIQLTHLNLQQQMQHLLIALPSSNLGFFRALFRHFIKYLLISVLPPMMILHWQNPYRRGIHDYLSGTVVVERTDSRNLLLVRNANVVDVGMLQNFM